MRYDSNPLANEEMLSGASPLFVWGLFGAGGSGPGSAGPPSPLGTPRRPGKATQKSGGAPKDTPALFIIQQIPRAVTCFLRFSVLNFRPQFCVFCQWTVVRRRAIL